MSFLWTEALLGAGESSADWRETQEASFRYGAGTVSKTTTARAKWNVIGHSLTWWSPRGPEYGTVEVRVDGRTAATLNLNAERTFHSQPVWSLTGLPDRYHTVVLLSKSGLMPVDSLEVAVGFRR